MWKRFAGILVCPNCKGELDLISTEECEVDLKPEQYAKGELMGIEPSMLNVYVDSGMLLCNQCKYWFPIRYGMPVLLPFETPLFQEFREKHKEMISENARGYTPPKESSRPGEEFVLRSFSKEWLKYDYDGVLWGWSYEDREETLLIEMGVGKGQAKGVRFLDVGCGLGVTTWIAERNYCVDAVGIDLSLAVLKASEHYKKNPFLHFAQASLFKLPIKEDVFDLVYAHGVLHHTYSTREAMEAIATCCTPGGLTYLWVYGKHGLTDSWDRRLGYFAEKHLRPFLSWAPAWVATVTLIPVAFGYIFLNSLFRVRNPKLQRYNFRRALHAARDRFTPLFAHRHSYEEVEGWFKDFGYEHVEMLDWRLVPAVVRALFRGAVAVRGWKKKKCLEK
jgi:SAM-dependent methyltransferase/uncharacterized protein YbaR (Trm112 family)